MAFAVPNWKGDIALEADLKKYVLQRVQRNEILDYVERDYPNYMWSMRSLDRRLRHFNIYYTDNNVSVDDVKAAVQKEMEGPGILLGYRAMQNKVRQKHGLKVPRDLVHNVMYDELCPEELEKRRLGNKKKAKGHFTTKAKLGMVFGWS